MPSDESMEIQGEVEEFDETVYISVQQCLESSIGLTVANMLDSHSSAGAYYMQARLRAQGGTMVVVTMDAEADKEDHVGAIVFYVEGYEGAE